MNDSCLIKRTRHIYQYSRPKWTISRMVAECLKCDLGHILAPYDIFATYDNVKRTPHDMFYSSVGLLYAMTIA